jgi:DNA-binding MarR family transcriptional regulator
MEGMRTATNPGTGAPADEAWALLRELAMAQRGAMLAVAAELQLSPPQLFALQALRDDEPAPMNGLADVLRCDASNVTGLIDRLEARGLVERRPAPHDRRVRHLVLTDEGRRLRAAVAERLSRPPAGLSALSDAETRRLRDLLAKVAAAPGAVGDLGA